MVLGQLTWNKNKPFSSAKELLTPTAITWAEAEGEKSTPDTNVRHVRSLLRAKVAKTHFAACIPKLGVKVALNLAAKQGINFCRSLLPFDRNFAKSPSTVTTFCFLQRGV